MTLLNAALKMLSMLWCAVFSGVLGMITAAAFASLQWLLFSLGFYIPESGRAFSSDFWKNFFILSGWIGLGSFILFCHEFWGDGITIDRNKNV